MTIQIAETGAEITLTDLGALLGLNETETAQAIAAVSESESDARIARLHAKRAAARDAEAKVAALPDGTIVNTEFGYYLIESRHTAATWIELGDGDHAMERQVVTVSKCRKNGQRLKTQQQITVNASEFGHWF